MVFRMWARTSMALAFCLGSVVGVSAAEGLPAIGGPSLPIELSAPSALSEPVERAPSVMVGPSTAPPPSVGFGATRFQDVPSISGEYQVGGNTIIPYLGAGFGNGYASDLDRSLNSGPPAMGDLSLRNLLGPNLIPNEVRMGIRIPF